MSGVCDHVVQDSLKVELASKEGLPEKITSINHRLETTKVEMIIISYEIIFLSFQLKNT